MPNIGPMPASFSISASAWPPDIRRIELELISSLPILTALRSPFAQSRDKIQARHPDPGTRCLSAGIDTRHIAIGERGAGIANARAPGTDGGRRNLAGIERRQPRKSRAVDAAVGIVIDGGHHRPLHRRAR